MSDTKQIWLQKVADFHGLDPEDIIEVVEICVDDTSKNLLKLNSINLAENNKEAIRLTHSIKGASSNIQLNEISEAAAAVEKQLRENNYDNIKENINRIETAFKKFLELYQS